MLKGLLLLAVLLLAPVPAIADVGSVSQVSVSCNPTSAYQEVDMNGGALNQTAIGCFALITGVSSAPCNFRCFGNFSVAWDFRVDAVGNVGVGIGYDSCSYAAGVANCSVSITPVDIQSIGHVLVLAIFNGSAGASGFLLSSNSTWSPPAPTVEGNSTTDTGDNSTQNIAVEISSNVTSVMNARHDVALPPSLVAACIPWSYLNDSVAAVNTDFRTNFTLPFLFQDITWVC